MKKLKDLLKKIEVEKDHELANLIKSIKANEENILDYISQEQGVLLVVPAGIDYKKSYLKEHNRPSAFYKDFDEEYSLFLMPLREILELKVPKEVLSLYSPLEILEYVIDDANPGLNDAALLSVAKYEAKVVKETERLKNIDKEASGARTLEEILELTEDEYTDIEEIQETEKMLLQDYAGWVLAEKHKKTMIAKIKDLI